MQINTIVFLTSLLFALSSLPDPIEKYDVINFIRIAKADTTQILDSNKIIASGAQLKKLGDGYTFTEGPAVDKHGNVFFTDQPNNKIVEWTEDKNEFSTFVTASGRSNGTYIDASGNLITCADMDNQLWSIDPNGKITVLIDNFEGKRLNGPNDLWINPKNGCMYITDPLYEREYWTRDPAMQQEGQYVYFFNPKTKEFKPVEKDLIRPNGIVGTPDAKHLYVADRVGDKTYVFDIEKNGTLSNKKQFAPKGSDGMTIDNEGNVYLTGDGVTVYDKSGKKIAHIPINESWTANVVFAGKDRKTLFITAMGSIYTIQMRVGGVVK